MKIKFRGFSNSLQDWVYGEYRRVGKDISSIYSYKDEQLYIIKHGSLGQYLGFKDDAGKEVYEGDVIDIYNAPKMVAGRYRLIRQMFDIMAVNVDDSCISYSLNAIIDYYFKIIGNVYENKEFAEEIFGEASY